MSMVCEFAKTPPMPPHVGFQSTRVQEFFDPVSRVAENPTFVREMTWVPSIQRKAWPSGLPGVFAIGTTSKRCQRPRVFVAALLFMFGVAL